ncbi:MAG TPA: hypothetical protein VIR29_14640 [Anseongella sp.]
MIKYSTPNDLLRLFREEETEEGNPFTRTASETSENLALLKEMLDRLRAEPREECTRHVLEYSRSLDIGRC